MRLMHTKYFEDTLPVNLLTHMFFLILVLSNLHPVSANPYQIESSSEAYFGRSIEYTLSNTPNGYYNWCVYNGVVEGASNSTESSSCIKGQDLSTIVVSWTDQLDIKQGYIQLTVFDDESESSVITSHYLHVNIKYPFSCQSLIPQDCEKYNLTCEELNNQLTAYGLQRVVDYESPGSGDYEQWKHAFLYYNEAINTYPHLADCDIPFDDILNSAMPSFGGIPFEEQDRDLVLIGADTRIEKYRKSGVIVSITDETGNPLPEAEIVFNQETRDFDFGTALRTAFLEVDYDKPDFIRDIECNHYFELFDELEFNKVVPEDRLRNRAWSQLGVGHRNHLYEALKVFKSRKLKIRGHPLTQETLIANFDGQVYGLDNEKRKNIPFVYDPNYEGYHKNFEEIKADILTWAGERFQEIRLNVGDDIFNYLDEWDVLNHPVKNEEFPCISSEAEKDVCEYTVQNDALCPAGLLKPFSGANFKATNCWENYRYGYNYKSISDDDGLSFYNSLFSTVSDECSHCKKYINEDFILFGFGRPGPDEKDRLVYDDLDLDRAYGDKMKLLENHLDGIGFQSHFIHNDMYNEGVLRGTHSAKNLFNKLAKFSDENWLGMKPVPIQITEFDYAFRIENIKTVTEMQNSDLSQQDRIRQMEDSKKLLTTMMSHRNVEGIVLWGLVDFLQDKRNKKRRLHWRPTASFYEYDDNNPNAFPKAKVLAEDGVTRRDWLKEFLNNETMTVNEKIKLDDKGLGYLRVFKGEYSVTISVNGISRTFGVPNTSEFIDLKDYDRLIFTLSANGECITVETPDQSGSNIEICN